MALLSPLIAACSHDSPAEAPNIAQAQATLDHYAAAVLAHRADAAAAQLDAGAASKAFADRQRSVLADLRDVPLAAWSYRVVAPVTEPPATTAAGKRYGRPSLIARVELSYRLDGVDRTPSVHEQWLTFVRRDGHTTLAGDDDLAASGGTSWRGVWDFGPVVVARGVHGLVFGHPDRAARVADLAAALDRAVPAVDAVWDRDWSQAAAVLVPDDAAEFSALAGDQPLAGTGADVGAVTVLERSGAAASRIVISPAAVRHLSTSAEQVLLRHELTHVATAAVTTDGMPRWLVEGFAEYVARPDETGTTLTAMPSHLPADAAFDPSTPTAVAAYEQGRLACAYVVSLAGRAGLARLYGSAGSAGLPEALHTVLGTDVAGFESGWRTYVGDALR
jgi:hypothetical protein